MEPPSDPRALRALAHPLRWKLVDLLARDGAATATRCAEELGESVASCSFHLNMLARYGFVEPAPGGRGREKPWRLTTVEPNLAPAALGPPGRPASRAAREVFLDHELARLKDRLAHGDAEPDEWRRGIGFDGVTTALTADELHEVSEALREIAMRYADRATHRHRIPPGAREVRIFTATSVTPLPGPR